jgi:hypothetical protein
MSSASLGGNAKNACCSPWEAECSALFQGVRAARRNRHRRDGSFHPASTMRRSSISTGTRLGLQGCPLRPRRLGANASQLAEADNVRVAVSSRCRRAFDPRPPFHRSQHPRGELSRLVFTLVRTVPPHIDKPTGFPSVPGEGRLLNDIGGWRGQKRAPRK